MLHQEYKPDVTPYPETLTPAVVSALPSSNGNPQYLPQPRTMSSSEMTSPSASEVGGQSSSAQRPPMSHASSAVSSTVTLSPNQPNSKAAQVGLLSIARLTTYHADSGIRFNPQGEGSSSAVPEVEEPIDVPPSYSEN
ncbi:hypothetical protein AcV5_001326 [Taiwanofungus camphoratus]|nr:hypothetical protein AcW2_006048 [Antrodia cinnamomea]KAI0940137.1 hypothetical protein AcV5_001326 [Antrodia cinnamomea]KAI0941314.1 hypothetical protein AcV7_002919 [Antrodia cinnamomea]